MTYKDKLKSMTVTELDRELKKVIDMRAEGYQRLGRGDLMIEASIKLCNDAIEAIKLEINSRKA